VKRKIVAALFRVLAFKTPGPKWHTVGEPLERENAVRIIAAEWKAGHVARLVPVVPSEQAKVS
jgi:hypothetical protein